MNQYQWLKDENGNIIYDYSDEELSRRREYLLAIDRYAKLSYKDLKRDLHPGKNIIAWGPGMGKTTALRQFLCRPEVIGSGALVACHRIDYIDQLVYDLSAMLPNHKDTVIAFHSQSEASRMVAKDLDYLKDYKIVVTTHQRLLLDDPSILLNTSDRYNKLGANSSRKYILIDESPNYLSKIRLSNAGLSTILSHMQYIAKDLNCDISELDYRLVIETIHKDLIDSRDFFNLKMASYEGLVGKKTYDDISNTTIASSRFLHKLSVVVKSIIDTYKSRVIDNDFYYHLGLLDSEYIAIFDGTGDLTNKTSEVWNVSVTTPREVTLNDLRILPNTDLPRRPDSCIDYKEFTDSITELSKSHEKILVVTWKDLKDDASTLHTEVDYSITDDTQLISDDNLDVYAVREVTNKELVRTQGFVDYLRSKLSYDVNSKVEFITYLSGKERVTSEYSDCDCILFLGKFFLPNSEVDKLNKLKKSNESTKDYTSSLLVQAIYRTRARHGKPISMYFTSDWKTDMVSSVLNSFDTVNDNTGNIRHYQYDSLLSTIRHTKRSLAYYSHIMSKRDELISTGSARYYVPNGVRVSDYKSGIKNLVRKYEWITYVNIPNTREFMIKLY